MPGPEPLRADHAAALLEWKAANREYFSRPVLGLGDDCFAEVQDCMRFCSPNKPPAPATST